MAIGINGFKQLIEDLISSNNGGRLSPQEFVKLTNKASLARFNTLFGKSEQFRYGNPAPRTGYGQSLVIDEALSPFIKTATLTVTDGVATLPADVVHLDTVEYNDKSCRRVNSDRWSVAKNSVLDAPTTDFPIYTKTGELTVEIRPTTITSVKVKYLKLPNEVNWAYNISSGRPVYTTSGSVDLEWNKSEEMNLAFLVLSYIGITIADAGMVQYAEGQKQQGN